MFRKATVKLEDGFAYGEEGWVVTVLMGDILGWPDKIAGLSFKSREDAVKTYNLLQNVIANLQQ